MASSFYVKEHTIEAQHIREYSKATARSQEEVLFLSIKQYTPKSNPEPKPGDVTIIAGHANGFVKVSAHPSPHRSFILSIVLGALRALVGGSYKVPQREWNRGPRHMDGGCSMAGSKRDTQREQPGKRPYELRLETHYIQ
jgi:hypothetical protein